MKSKLFLFLFIVIILLSIFLFLPSVYAAVKAYQVATPVSKTLPPPYEHVIFDSTSITVTIDPATTNWIALSSRDSLADLATGDNGNIPPDGILDINHPNVDDYIVVTVSKGSAVSQGITLDSNDAVACRMGNQAVLYGFYNSVRALDCINFEEDPPIGHTATFQESGELTDFFNSNGEGDYTFKIDFYNAHTTKASHGNIWLLMEVGEGTNAPEITLEPAEYPWFQASILLQEGFVIRIRDEDGIKDSEGNWMLDWTTLRFYLNGVDISAHFVTTAVNNNIITWIDTYNEILFFVKPDPKKFMSQHDVFGIPWNGTHRITFSICDTSGLCDSSDYIIYFGPFALFGTVIKTSCTAGKNYFYLDYIFWGNIGYDSGKNTLYSVLNEKGKDYRSQFSYGDYVSYEFGIIPYHWQFSLPTGQYFLDTEWEFYASILNGDVIYYLAVIDEESGAHQIDFEDFVLCK